MESQTIIAVGDATARFSFKDGLFNLELLTRAGEPSELSAYGLAIDDLAEAAADLQQLSKACPALARTKAGFMSAVYRARRLNAEAAWRTAA